jgi:hypothetical protein
MNLVTFTKLIIDLGIKAKLEPKIFYPLEKLYDLGNIIKFDIKHNGMVILGFLEELKYWEIIEDMVIVKKSKTKFKIGKKKLIKIVLQTMVL